MCNAGFIILRPAILDRRPPTDELQMAFGTIDSDRSVEVWEIPGEDTLVAERSSSARCRLFLVDRSCYTLPLRRSERCYQQHSRSSDQQIINVSFDRALSARRIRRQRWPFEDNAGRLT
jgi:hypothetical protein